MPLASVPHPGASHGTPGKGHIGIGAAAISKGFWTIALVFCAIGACSGAHDPEPSPFDQSTPESTLEAMLRIHAYPLRHEHVGLGHMLYTPSLAVEGKRFDYEGLQARREAALRILVATEEAFGEEIAEVARQRLEQWLGVYRDVFLDNGEVDWSKITLDVEDGTAVARFWTDSMHGLNVEREMRRIDGEWFISLPGYTRWDVQFSEMSVQITYHRMAERMNSLANRIASGRAEGPEVVTEGNFWW